MNFSIGLVFGPLKYSKNRRLRASDGKKQFIYVIKILANLAEQAGAGQGRRGVAATPRPSLWADENKIPD
jgi:hypothetical protein